MTLSYKKSPALRAEPGPLYASITAVHPSGPLPITRNNTLSSSELITQSFIEVNKKTFYLYFLRTNLRTGRSLIEKQKAMLTNETG